jgi:hypothetical protein
MKKKYKFKAKVWIWPGDAGWHFVNLPKEMSVKIRSVYTKGFVPIIANIGKTKWETSLFPHKLSGYLLSVKKDIRKKEGIYEGEEITVIFEIR